METKDLAKKTASNKVGDFKLREFKDQHYTIVALSKRQSLVINNGKTEIKNTLFPDGLKPATSEQLKKIYDSNPCHQKMIIAPVGYKAPWSK